VAVVISVVPRGTETVLCCISFVFTGRQAKGLLCVWATLNPSILFQILCCILITLT